MSHSVAPVVAPVASTSPSVGPVGLLASAATAHWTAESSSPDSYTSAHGGPPAAVPEPCVVAPSKSDPQVEGAMRRASGRQRAPVSHYEAGAAPCPRALHAAAAQHSGLSVPPSELSTQNIAELARLAKWAPPDAPALRSRQEGPETAAAAAAGWAAAIAEHASLAIPEGYASGEGEAEVAGALSSDDVEGSEADSDELPLSARVASAQKQQQQQQQQQQQRSVWSRPWTLGSSSNGGCGEPSTARPATRGAEPTPAHLAAGGPTPCDEPLPSACDEPLSCDEPLPSASAADDASMYTAVVEAAVEKGAVLSEHGAVLSEHVAMLSEHDAVLSGIGAVLSGNGAVLSGNGAVPAEPPGASSSDVAASVATAVGRGAVLGSGAAAAAAAASRASPFGGGTGATAACSSCCVSGGTSSGVSLGVSSGISGVSSGVSSGIELHLPSLGVSSGIELSRLAGARYDALYGDE